VSTRNEQIRCPHCKLVCNALVTLEDYIPFAVYIHECTGCGCMIGESEWDVVGGAA
jgi:hypothetical protein